MPFGPWPGSSGGGTLAKIYAFGLADNPPVDNVFDTTGYQQTFPLSDANANDYVMGTFEKVLNGQSNTFVNYWRRKGDHTINTEKVFNILSINDPTWNGSGDTLAPVQTWTAEKIYYGQDADNQRQFTAFQAFLGGRFWTWQDGGTLVYDGTPGRGHTLGPGKNLSRDQWGWNHIFSVGKQNQRQSGYGWIQNQLNVDIHGVAATHIEQVTYGSLSGGGLLPGDGMAYMFAVGSLFDFNGTNIKGWFGVRSPDDAEGNADNSSWYASIAASRGFPSDLTLVDEVAQFWARGSLGMLLQLGGVQYPNSDSTTFTTSDGASARVIYDDNLQTLQLSTDGAPFHPLPESYITAKVDLTALGGPFTIVPARAGFVFILTRISSLTTDAAGTASTAPTVSFNSGGNVLSSVSTVPGTAQFPKGGSTGLGIATTLAAPYLANQPITVTVTNAATGVGLTWKAVYLVTGQWVPLP